MKIRILAVLLASIFVFASCGASDSKKMVTLKIGINGDENKVWKSVKERLIPEGINIEIISFSDYILPNTALANGEIDANAFQTEIFFKNYLKDSGSDLSVLGYTVLAPMGIYPGTESELANIKDGAKIAIPNDVSNGGRALVLLQSAGLIEVDPEKGQLPSVKDITSNQKNIQIIEMVPAQIPSTLNEVDFACINNGVAIDFNLKPTEDSVFIEDRNEDYMKNYFNIIAVKTSRLDDENLKKLIEVYQTEETKKVIEEEYKGGSIPIF